MPTRRKKLKAAIPKQPEKSVFGSRKSLRDLTIVKGFILEIWCPFTIVKSRAFCAAKNRFFRLFGDIRKRSYLLLEVLISLTLVLIILVPLIKPLYGIRKIERDSTVHDELEREARFYFSGIKAALHENSRHSWEELKGGCRGDLEKGSYTILPREIHTKNSTHTSYLLSDCIIIFRGKTGGKTHTFSFPLIIEKKEVG